MSETSVLFYHSFVLRLQIVVYSSSEMKPSFEVASDIMMQKHTGVQRRFSTSPIFSFDARALSLSLSHLVAVINSALSWHVTEHLTKT